MSLYLGLDIGGTHVGGALVNGRTAMLQEGSLCHYALDTQADRETILAAWKKAIETILKDKEPADLDGIGIAMPGPFDYEKGISLIKGRGKYDALFGVDIKETLQAMLHLPADFPLYFENDAICFAQGEYWGGLARNCPRLVALTLGTGLGASFLDQGMPVQDGPGVPEGGTLYQLPYGAGMAEDHFSSHGLVHQYALLTGETIPDSKTLYQRALKEDQVAMQVFADFGRELAVFLGPWLRSFRAECLVLGGNISKAAPFFGEAMKNKFNQLNVSTKVMITELGEKASILGAASLPKNHDQKDSPVYNRRQSNQPLLPLRLDKTTDQGYSLYPVFSLEGKKIFEGLESLSAYILEHKTVLIDGYSGVFWKELERNLRALWQPQQLTVRIYHTDQWLLPPEKIKTLVAPYLGETDSVWGKICDKTLADFLDPEKIKECSPASEADIHIVMGVGAGLLAWDVPLIYVDLPKNELQYRMRSGTVTNIGSRETEVETAMYKRFYFVDWVVLNRHKKSLLERVEVIVDDQHPDTITWMHARDLKQALTTMSENVFRARPWFEPGAWGGQWIMEHIKGINQAEINYAWGFELITPENGLLLESDGWVLEVSFDWLMYAHHEAVLGQEFAAQFGYTFPIRFDFLDTFAGGNLSIQCHPSVPYIQKHFGENFTQDETYYILDADKGAGVFLGFQENIDPDAFRETLERSNRENVPVDITQYVQRHPAKKHDLFLIPNGTVHSAGTGNLVLEISATPYIYTFKMYDWLRPDLNGNPRPINIAHAFNNLDFSRQGTKVTKELIAPSIVLASGEDWELIHLPTHPAHYYDVHRYEFITDVQIATKNSCHVLMLVEGSAVTVETEKGFRQRFHYGETFVIPAAAKNYRLINEGKQTAKVVKAFLKPLSR